MIIKIYWKHTGIRSTFCPQSPWVCRSRGSPRSLKSHFCLKCVLLKTKRIKTTMGVASLILNCQGWGQRLGISKLFSQSSRANLVPVLIRSTSGPLTGARLTNTATGSMESLRAPSADTWDTLETRWGRGQRSQWSGVCLCIKYTVMWRRLYYLHK